MKVECGTIVNLAPISFVKELAFVVVWALLFTSANAVATEHGNHPDRANGKSSDPELDYRQCLSLRSDKSNGASDRDAARYCIRAADAGVGRANAIVGFLYALGDGVPKSTGKAVEYWKRGAAANDPSSLRMLGGLHENGQWVRRDKNLAVQLYKRAAELGDPIARERLKSLGEL